jgi:hypothetical protein
VRHNIFDAMHSYPHQTLLLIRTIPIGFYVFTNTFGSGFSLTRKKVPLPALSLNIYSPTIPGRVPWPCEAYLLIFKVNRNRLVVKINYLLNVFRWLLFKVTLQFWIRLRKKFPVLIRTYPDIKHYRCRKTGTQLQLFCFLSRLWCKTTLVTRPSWPA